VFFEKSFFLEHFNAGFSVTFPETFLSFIWDDFWDFYYIDVIFILRRFLYVFLHKWIINLKFNAVNAK